MISKPRYLMLKIQAQLSTKHLLHTRYYHFSLWKMQTLRIRIRQQPLLAHLPSESTILHTREEGPKVGSLKLVDPDTPRLETPGNPLRLCQIR